MSFRLYTRGDCPACVEVKSFLQRHGIEFILIDLDEKEPKGDEHFVKIVPALFKEDRLMAYGVDIIAYLSAVNKVVKSA